MRDAAELTKARLSLLVVFTTLVGYVLGCMTTGGFDWWVMLGVCVGTALAAASASIVNQMAEISRDRLMHRTRERPLPTGRVKPAVAFVLATLLAYAGAALIALSANLLAAGLALLTLLGYALLYTPLKRHTSLNTLFGAACGALPPMIGWSGATGGLETGAWLLAAILFVWQLPHFMALAWLYREDYARGGFVMLPHLDPDGSITAKVAVLSSLVLVALVPLCILNGLAGWVFGISATVLGLWMVVRATAFMKSRTDLTARRLFLASLVYMMLVMSMLLIDAGAPVRPAAVQAPSWASNERFESAATATAQASLESDFETTLGSQVLER